jgi:hypothetical protein
LTSCPHSLSTATQQNIASTYRWPTPQPKRNVSVNGYAAAPTDHTGKLIIMGIGTLLYNAFFDKIFNGGENPCKEIDCGAGVVRCVILLLRNKRWSLISTIHQYQRTLSLHGAEMLFEPLFENKQKKKKIRGPSFVQNILDEKAHSEGKNVHF